MADKRIALPFQDQLDLVVCKHFVDAFTSGTTTTEDEGFEQVAKGDIIATASDVYFVTAVDADTKAITGVKLN